MAALLFRAVVYMAFVLIIGPVLITIIVSFSSGNSLAFPPPGLSFRWFFAFFDRAEMVNAFLLSIGLAVAAACSSVMVGLLAAIYTSRHRGALSSFVQTLVMAPLVFPSIILGLALLLLYKSIQVGVLPGLFFAHLVVCLPYAFRATLTSLQSFDTSLEEAGQSLGAGPIRSFFRITMPIIWPGILSGWLFAFVVSFGELNAALFLTGPGVVTLPIEIFSYLQFEGDQLVVAAASTLQVATIVLALALTTRVVGTKRIIER